MEGKLYPYLLCSAQLLCKQAQADNLNLTSSLMMSHHQFHKEYQEIGKALENAKAAYEKGEKKITDGGQSINTTAKQLISLGAKQSNKNPLPYISNNEDINDLITT